MLVNVEIGRVDYGVAITGLRLQNLSLSAKL